MRSSDEAKHQFQRAVIRYNKALDKARVEARAMSQAEELLYDMGISIHGEYVKAGLPTWRSAYTVYLLEQEEGKEP